MKPCPDRALWISPHALSVFTVFMSPCHSCFFSYEGGPSAAELLVVRMDEMIPDQLTSFLYEDNSTLKNTFFLFHRQVHLKLDQTNTQHRQTWRDLDCLARMGLVWLARVSFTKRHLGDLDCWEAQDPTGTQSKWDCHQLKVAATERFSGVGFLCSRGYASGWGLA